MNFWAWLFNPGAIKKSADEYEKEIKDLQEEIVKLEKEVCHWKSIALNFRKFHQ